MKTFYSFLVLLSLILYKNSAAQENWVSYANSIDVKDYGGCPFRLSAYVRVERDDDSASARLWTRIEKQDPGGFFDNMWYKPIRSNEWKIYTIEGIIDSNADRLSFGALCQFNGRFYYDNYKVEVDNGRNWFTLYKDEFEKEKDLWAQGSGNGEPGYGTNPFFDAKIISGHAANGIGCLCIEGLNVPNFGVNKKAGSYAEVNGIRLYYEIYGEGNPLLVLHGNGGSISDAAPMYPELIKKYKVIAVDSRGQGNSSDNNEELTYDLMASDVNELLNKLNLDSVYIWGQSDGAILGLILAMNYPDKVKKVVAFGANIQSDTLAIFPSIYDHIIKTIKETKDVRIRKWYTLMYTYPDIPFSDLHKIEAPVLIVAGDRDFIRPEHTLKLFQNIPNSQMCILPGATHGASWEKLDVFMKIIEEFFDKPFKMPSTEDWYR